MPGAEADETLHAPSRNNNTMHAPTHHRRAASSREKTQTRESRYGPYGRPHRPIQPTENETNQIRQIRASRDVFPPLSQDRSRCQARKLTKHCMRQAETTTPCTHPPTTAGRHRRVRKPKPVKVVTALTAGRIVPSNQ